MPDDDDLVIGCQLAADQIIDEFGDLNWDGVHSKSGIEVGNVKWTVTPVNNDLGVENILSYGNANIFGSFHLRHWSHPEKGMLLWSQGSLATGNCSKSRE